MKKISVGIDIGGTNTSFGFVDMAGIVLASGNIPTQTRERIEDFVSDLAQAIQKVRKDILFDFELLGIGIGAPNGNYYTGTIEYAPNLRWKGIINLASLFTHHFQCPVYVTNDANAAAMGEMIYGSAKNIRDFIMITLGTGLGSGFVVNGELVYGHDGFAGEMGHVIVERNGRLCGCGRKGCLEAYCSAPGIAKTAIELLQSNGNSILHQIPFEKLGSKDVSEAAEKGDALALHVFEITGEILGLALANAVAVTSPKAIFLFGGPTQAGEILFDPIRRHFEKNVLAIYRNKVRILPSGLPPGDAAIVGASALVWNELSKNQHQELITDNN